MEKRDRAFLWLCKHTPELQEQYAGKWIAVVNEEVVGSGNTATEAYRQARERHPDVKPLLDVVPTEECLILWNASIGR